MVEARSLHVIVSSDHPSADEQVAEAIARVASRYAVDLTPEIEVNMPQAGITVPYVGKAALRFSSRLRAAIRARGGSRSWMAKHQSAPASTSSVPKNPRGSQRSMIWSGNWSHSSDVLPPLLLRPTRIAQILRAPRISSTWTYAPEGEPPVAERPAS